MYLEATSPSNAHEYIFWRLKERDSFTDYDFFNSRNFTITVAVS